MTDPQLYRVTYVCKCAADYAEGYGATIEEAEANLRRFWRKDGHKIRDIASRTVETAKTERGGYQHYVEVLP